MIRLRHIASLAVCLAHPASGQGLETAARDAQRYVDCIDALDIACLETLTYPAPSACDTLSALSSLVRGRHSLLNAGELGDFDDAYWHVEPAAPVPIEADDEGLYVFVPIRINFRINLWTEQPGYLLGVSENDGESWRFVEHGIVRLQGIDGIVPGYIGPPPPDLTSEPPADPYAVKSEYLITRAAGFVLGMEAGSAAVKLEFDVRERIRKPLAIYAAFENQQASAEPFMTNSILVPRQETLSLSLPPISGLRAGQYYEVAVFGVDPDTDDVVFEHRQLLRYFPVVDYFDEVLPAIAGPPIENLRIFTSGNGYIVSTGPNPLNPSTSQGLIRPASQPILGSWPAPRAVIMLESLPANGIAPRIPGCE